MKGFAPEVLGAGSVLFFLGLLGMILGDVDGDNFAAADMSDPARFAQAWHPYTAFVHHHWSAVFGSLALLGMVGVVAGLWSMRARSMS